MSIYYLGLLNEINKGSPWYTAPENQIHHNLHVNNMFQPFQTKNKNKLLIVSHHGKLKKLLNIYTGTKNPGIANCTCLKISKNDYHVDVIFGGFPDKENTLKKTKKHRQDGGGTYQYLTTNQQNVSCLPTKELDNIIQHYDEIYIVRHGNGLHNGPIKKKKIDSVLSIFGVLQAYLLGLVLKTHGLDINEFDIITSELMRAQHTALQVISVLDPQYQNILDEYNSHRNDIIKDNKVNEYRDKYIDAFTYQLNIAELCSNYDLDLHSIPNNLRQIAREVGVECLPCKEDEGEQYCENFGSRRLSRKCDNDFCRPLTKNEFIEFRKTTNEPHRSPNYQNIVKLNSMKRVDFYKNPKFINPVYIRVGGGKRKTRKRNLRKKKTKKLRK